MTKSGGGQGVGGGVVTYLKSKGWFPVMAEITRILAANICRQFFFVITTTESTLCLVQNFQLICYSQLVNATSQYKDSASARCWKWPKGRMPAVVKHCWLLVQGRRGCRERWLKTTTAEVFKKILPLFERPARLMFIKLWHLCDDRKLFCELASTC